MRPARPPMKDARVSDFERDFAESWIAKIKQGDSAAADAIWDHCFPELIRFSQKRLQGMPAMRETAEDVALSALKSFMVRAESGQLEQAKHMWKLLYRIAACKAAAYRRKKVNQSPTIAPSTIQETASTVDSLSDVISDLLDMLDDDNVRKIGKYHLYGYNNREIAETIGCSTETVRRKLITIKQKWKRESDNWLDP